MSIFDLIFAAWFLGSVAYALVICVFLLMRRWTTAKRHAIRLGVTAAAYLAVVVVVGITSPRRINEADAVMRFDDWCIGVEKTTFAEAIGDVRPAAGKRFAFVTLKVINAAHRRRQAAPAGSLAYLLDAGDQRYDVHEPGQLAYEKTFGAQTALTMKLDAGSTFLTTRVFEVPRESGELFLAHRHGNGFPNILIIGDGFRKPSVIRLRT